MNIGVRVVLFKHFPCAQWALRLKDTMFLHNVKFVVFVDELTGMNKSLLEALKIDFDMTNLISVPVYQ